MLVCTATAAWQPSKSLSPQDVQAAVRSRQPSELRGPACRTGTAPRRAPSSWPRVSLLPTPQRAGHSLTELLYDLQVVLGKHRQTQKQHALKVVYLNKPGLKDKHIAVLQREGTYLRKLQHKNIVRCLRVYQAPQQWVFVLEYLKGGMLLNDLAKVRSICARPPSAACCPGADANALLGWAQPLRHAS
jgi:Protein kinase domain